MTPVAQHILSLGAGVQSSTLALMAARGQVGPMPQAAIFADTGWEPRAVYEWLDWLEKQLPFPVVRVGKGNIRSEQISAQVRGGRTNGARWASLPYFVDVGGPREGRITRQCTSEYKIAPIETYLRRDILKLAPRQRAPKGVQIVQWRGISADEAQRMKPSRHAWMEVRYPLAMELNYTRNDCLRWMERHGYPTPPRSACIGCPFHSDHEWRDMRDNRPAEWRDAVEFDAAIRDAGGMRGKSFLHRSLKPLAEAPIDGNTAQADLWGQECEGMCGV